MSILKAIGFPVCFVVGVVGGTVSMWFAYNAPKRIRTCHADETATIKCIRLPIKDGKGLTVHEMECSECGRTYEHINGDYQYCPHCGRRVENYKP